MDFTAPRQHQPLVRVLTQSVQEGASSQGGVIETGRTYESNLEDGGQCQEFCVKRSG